MRKLEENNRFVLETNNSKIAQQVNQFGHDTDFNSAIIEHNRKAANEHFDSGDIYTRRLALSVVSLFTLLQLHMCCFFSFC